MIFSYELNRFEEDGYIYIVKHEKNLFEFKVDINENFTNYIFINNWFDDINYFINKYYEIKKLPYSYSKIIHNRKEYTKSKQYQYDKYFYLLNIKNDNHKLYKNLYDQLIDYYLSENKKNKTIKITEI